MEINKDLIKALSTANLNPSRDALENLVAAWGYDLVAKALTLVFRKGCFSLKELVDLLKPLPVAVRARIFSGLCPTLQALVMAYLREESSQRVIDQHLRKVKQRELDVAKSTD